MSQSIGNRQIGNDPYEPPEPLEPPGPRLDGASPEPSMVYVAERTRWEYKVLSRSGSQDDAQCEQELNLLGSAGWELTSLVSQVDAVRYVFKRPRG